MDLSSMPAGGKHWAPATPQLENRKYVRAGELRT